jgi:hypothetical protein
VVSVADVRTGAEVAVVDALKKAGDHGELDGPLGEGLVAAPGVGDKPEMRITGFRNHAEGFHDGRGRISGVVELHDTGVQVPPHLGAKSGARRSVVCPRRVVWRSGEEDRVGGARVLHEAAEDSGGLARQGAYEALPLVAGVEKGTDLESGWSDYTMDIWRDANIVRRKAGGKWGPVGAVCADHSNAGCASGARGAEASGATQECKLVVY